MNLTRYIFETSTGKILHRYEGPADQLDANLPSGCDHLDAQLVSDPLSQRVEVTSGQAQVVDWQPPRPDEFHFWDTKSRRWLLNPIIAERRQREIDILAAIKGIDERIIRPLVELQIDPNDKEAQQIRDKLSAEKIKLRDELRALRETK